ncbi:septum formation initiator family protein [Geomonas agri]|uniref:septum formation initiator family protein n=1 Tax=Geomonas agri TaxID=2873702 RepID=UPI001CD597DA|nr:septum formation initiator family protein [Geomonas agri]
MKMTMLIICLAALVSAGCATTGSREGNFLERYNSSRQLSQAETMLKEGDTHGAINALDAICNGPAVTGVTDEALFRLALLTLKVKPGSAQALHLLKRLKKEYPASQWTALAAPVSEQVNALEEQRRQNKVLKGSNQALSREITELNQRLEQLKNLDQELEKKAR